MVLWHVQGYPAMPGQKFGPAWFPGLVAVGLIVCGGVLAAQALRQPAALFTAPPWIRSSKAAAGVASVVAGLLFYIFAAEALGFYLTALLVLVAWMRVLGARWSLALPVAAAATIVIHLAFYKLLRIPLPWGVLQRFAF